MALTRVQKEEKKGRVEEGERVEWRGGGDEAPVSPLPFTT
jgi:hypothetical protein